MQLRTLLIFVIMLLLSTVGYGQQHQKEKYRNKANDPNYPPCNPIPRYDWPNSSSCNKTLISIFSTSSANRHYPRMVAVIVERYDFRKHCFILRSPFYVSREKQVDILCEYYPKAKMLVNITDTNVCVLACYDHRYDTDIDHAKCFLPY